MEEEQEIDLLQFWQTLMKRKWMILGIMAVAMVAAYVLSTLMTPVYEAETIVMTKQNSTGMLLSFGDLGLGGGGGQNVGRNYVELLRSRSVLTRALKSLGLTAGEDCPDLEELQKAVSAQAVAQTDAIKITVQLADKALARDLANALVDILIEQNKEVNQTSSRVAREYLDSELKNAAENLRQAEERMLAVKEGKRVVAPTAEAEEQIRHLVELQGQKAAAEMALGEMQARVRELREQMSGMAETIVSQETVVEDPVVASYRASLAELEVQLAAAREKYTEAHPEVISLKTQIAEVKANLNSAVARVVGTQTSSPNPGRVELKQAVVQAETQMAASRAQAEALGRVIADEEAKLEKLPEKELDLARAMRDVELAQQIYIMLRTKYEEIRVNEQMQISEIWRVDPAITPNKPVKPRKMLNTAIAGILGLFVGVAGAFIVESGDVRMRSAEEIERELCLPIIGAIPIHVGVVQAGPDYAKNCEARHTYDKPHSTRRE